MCVFRPQTAGVFGNESTDALRSAQNSRLRRTNTARLADRGRRPLSRQKLVSQFDTRRGRAASDRHVFGEGSHKTAVGPVGRGLLSDRGHHARHRSSR